MRRVAQARSESELGAAERLRPVSDVEVLERLAEKRESGSSAPRDTAEALHLSPERLSRLRHRLDGTAWFRRGERRRPDKWRRRADQAGERRHADAVRTHSWRAAR